MIEDFKAEVANAREEQKMGNEKTSENSAEVSQPAISDEILEQASEAGWNSALPSYWLDETQGDAVPVPVWNDADEADKVTCRKTVLASLVAALPALRRQIAEEIAVALEAEAHSDYDAADDLRWASAKAREIGAKA